MPQDTQETGWIEWQGGECPVDPETPVKVQLASGERSIDRAGSYEWQHNRLGHMRSDDIIAYRVVSL